jgi:hypothetical protein
MDVLRKAEQIQYRAPPGRAAGAPRSASRTPTGRVPLPARKANAIDRALLSRAVPIKQSSLVPMLAFQVSVSTYLGSGPKGRKLEPRFTFQAAC